MPSRSKKDAVMMQIAAHDPAFTKKNNKTQSTAIDLVADSTKQNAPKKQTQSMNNSLRHY